MHVRMDMQMYMCTHTHTHTHTHTQTHTATQTHTNLSSSWILTNFANADGVVVEHKKTVSLFLVISVQIHKNTDF
jgi:hypothetical protein